MKMEAETGGAQLQTKGPPRLTTTPRNWRRQGKIAFSRDFRFLACNSMRQYLSTVGSHPVWGTLSSSPRTVTGASKGYIFSPDVCECHAHESVSWWLYNWSGSKLGAFWENDMSSSQLWNCSSISAFEWSPRRWPPSDHKELVPLPKMACWLPGWPFATEESLDMQPTGPLGGGEGGSQLGTAVAAHPQAHVSILPATLWE